MRGAVCCENTAQSISEQVKLLCERLFKANGVRERDVAFLLFSVTPDLTALNPASALRKSGFKADFPLFCCAEPNAGVCLPCTVRVLLAWYGKKRPVPVYCGGAEELRPDLFS